MNKKHDAMKETATERVAQERNEAAARRNMTIAVMKERETERAAQEMNRASAR